MNSDIPLENKEKKKKKKKLFNQNQQQSVDAFNSQIAVQAQSEEHEELSHPVCNVDKRKQTERKRKLYNTASNCLEDIEINGPSTRKKEKRNSDKAPVVKNEVDDTSQAEEVLKSLGMTTKKKKKKKMKERLTSQSEDDDGAVGSKDKHTSFNFIAGLDEQLTTNKIKKKKLTKKERKEKDIFITQIPVSQLTIPGTQPYSELSQDTLVDTQEVNDIMKMNKKCKDSNSITNANTREPVDVADSTQPGITLSQFFSTQSQNTQIGKHEIIDIDQDDADSVVELPAVPISNSKEIDPVDSDIEFIESSNRKSQKNNIKQFSKNTKDTVKAAKGSEEVQDSIVIDSSLEGVDDKMSQPVCKIETNSLQNESDDDDFSFIVKKKKKSLKKIRNKDDNGINITVHEREEAMENIETEIDDDQPSRKAAKISKKHKKKGKNKEQDNMSFSDQDNTMESPEKKFCTLPEKSDELASSTKIWELSVQVEPDNEEKKPKLEEFEILNTDIEQVAPVKSPKKKKRKEVENNQEEGNKKVNGNKEHDIKEEENTNIKKKKKKKKKKKEEKNKDIEDEVEKNDKDTPVQIKNTKMKDKPKEKENYLDEDQRRLKNRPEISFDFESSMLKELTEEKDNVVSEEISRINSLYAKKIPRHPLLDKGKVTTSQLRKNNVQYTTGKWTNHELYMLFKNIKTAKSKYEIKVFKDFMLSESKNAKVKKIEVFRDLSTHLLRPISAIRKKLRAIYVTGEENPENRNKYYTPEENKRLLALVEKYKKNWKSISREMDRSIISCQCKYAILKKDNERQEKRKAKGFTQHQAFSPEEDKKLLDIVEKMKKQNKLTRGGKIPWVLVGEKLGTRDRRICQRRYTLLTKRDVVVKLSLAEKYALTIKVLRLFNSQNIEELSDVDWEKVKVGVGFKDHWSILRHLYQRFIDANVDRDLNTNQQRLDYLLANPSVRVINSASKS